MICSKINYHKSLLGIVNDELFSIVQLISHRRNFTPLSLFYCYFQDKCSDELQSLILQVQTLKNRTNLIRYRQSTPSFTTYSICKEEAQLKQIVHRNCHILESTKIIFHRSLQMLTIVQPQNMHFVNFPLCCHSSLIQ